MMGEYMRVIVLCAALALTLAGLVSVVYLSIAYMPPMLALAEQEPRQMQAVVIGSIWVIIAFSLCVRYRRRIMGA